MPTVRATFTTRIGLMSIYVVVAFASLTWNGGSGQESNRFETLDIEVIGRDYRIHFRYPGADRLLGTADDRFGSRDLQVPAGAVVRLHMSSEDYVYTLEIPEVGLYEVAVPDLVFDAQFVAPSGGTHALLGSQMCGYDHPELLGKLQVHSGAQFNQSMRRLSYTPTSKAP